MEKKKFDINNRLLIFKNEVIDLDKVSNIGIHVGEDSQQNPSYLFINIEGNIKTYNGIDLIYPNEFIRNQMKSGFHCTGLLNNYVELYGKEIINAWCPRYVKSGGVTSIMNNL